MINVTISPTTIQPKVIFPPSPSIKPTPAIKVTEKVTVPVVPKITVKKIIKTSKTLPKPPIQPTTLKAKLPQKETSTETRDVVIAGIDDPKGPTESEIAPVINMFRLQDFFGIDKPDYKQEMLLNKIYQYYEKKGLTNMDDVFTEILKLEQKLGSLPLLENRLTHLWNYITIFSLSS